MAKWKNTSNLAVIVGHVLVQPGETVEVPEKMLKILAPKKTPATQSKRTQQAKTSVEGDGEEKAEAGGEE